MRSVSAPSTSLSNAPAGLQRNQARSVSSPTTLGPSSATIVAAAAANPHLSHRVHRNEVIQPWAPPMAFLPPQPSQSRAGTSRHSGASSTAPVARSPLPSTFLPPPMQSTRRRRNRDGAHRSQNAAVSTSSSSFTHASSRDRSHGMKNATKCYSFVVCIMMENVSI